MNWITLPDGRKVREASGDIEVIGVDGVLRTVHYGELGDDVDAAAMESVTGD